MIASNDDASTPPVSRKAGTAPRKHAATGPPEQAGRVHPFRTDSLAARLYALKPGEEYVRPDDANERRACMRAVADIREREPRRDFEVTPFLMVFPEGSGRPSERKLRVLCLM